MQVFIRTATCPCCQADLALQFDARLVPRPRRSDLAPDVRVVIDPDTGERQSIAGPVLRWIRQRTEAAPPDAFTPMAALYADWIEWVTANPRTVNTTFGIASKRFVSDQLVAAGYHRAVRGNKRGFLGVRLRLGASMRDLDQAVDDLL